MQTKSLLADYVLTSKLSSCEETKSAHAKRPSWRSKKDAGETYGGGDRLDRERCDLIYVDDERAQVIVLQGHDSDRVERATPVKKCNALTTSIGSDCFKRAVSAGPLWLSDKLIEEDHSQP